MTKEQAIQLIYAYLDDSLSEQDAARLRDWLAESPDHVTFYGELSLVHTGIHRVLEVRDLGHSMHTLLKAEDSATGDVVDLESVLAQYSPEQNPTDPIPLRDLPEIDAAAARKNVKRRPAARPADDEDNEPVVNMFGVRVYRKTVERTAAPRSTRRFMAAAVVLLAVLAGVWWVNQLPAWDQPVATLQGNNGLVWEDGGTQWPLNSRLKPGRYTTTAGFGEIVFDRGATVLLQGPCEFIIANDNELTLTSGKIAAQITPSAVNFTVNTPRAKVVDLGTEFCVAVAPNGTTLTAVFDGTVDLAGFKGAKDHNNVLLGAGWQGTVDHKGRVEPATTQIPPDHAFTRSLAESHHELAVDGQVKWYRRPPANVRLDALKTKGYAVVFAERRGVVLDEVFENVLVDAGTYGEEDLHWYSEPIPKGTVVDSYLVHYEPDITLDEPTASVSLTIAFPRPIRGVVWHNKSLFASDGRFGLPRTEYPTWDSQVRGIDTGIGDGTDDLIIHPDGRTITLHLEVNNNARRNNVIFCDQVRVLIESDPPSNEGS